MTCREVTDFLMDYVEGGLAEDVRRCFEEHMAECPDCIAYLTTYRASIQLSKDAYKAIEHQLPAEAPDDLVRAILAARHGSSS